MYISDDIHGLWNYESLSNVLKFVDRKIFEKQTSNLLLQLTTTTNINSQKQWSSLLLQPSLIYFTSFRLVLYITDVLLNTIDSWRLVMSVVLSNELDLTEIS